MIKKFSGVIVLAALALASCQKSVLEPVHQIEESVDNNNGEKHLVTMTSFAQKLEDIDLKAKSSAYVKHAYYVLYSFEENNNRWVPGGFDDKTTDILSYSKELPAGKYRLFVVAGTNELLSEGYAKRTSVDEYAFKGAIETLWVQNTREYNQDIFMKDLEFVVKDTDLNLGPQNLDRLTAKLVLNVLDTPPANVTSLSMTVLDNYNVFGLAYRNVRSIIADETFSAAVGNQASGFVFGTDVVEKNYRINLRVDAKDAAGNVVATKTFQIPDAVPAGNEATIKLNLFDGSTSAVSVTLNDKWDNDVITTPF